MAGFSDYLEGKLLDHVFGSTAYSAPSSRYLRLHTGPPSDIGTANGAAKDTRKVVTFSAASDGAISSSAQVQWTAYDINGGSGTGATETLTHWSLWDASSAGNCLATGALGGIAPFSASTAAGAFTAQAHGLSVGHTVEVYPLPGSTLPSGLATDTAYTVATVPTANTFTLTGVTTPNGTCVVQRYIGKVVNDGDTVTIASGQVTIYSD